MHSYTLNNWDGSQSQESPLTPTTAKLRTNIKHDNSEPRPTSSVVADHGWEGTKDLAGSSRLIGTSDEGSLENMDSRRRTMTKDETALPDDADSSFKHANGTANDSSTVIPRAYKRSKPRLPDRVSPVTKSFGGHVRDQPRAAFNALNSARITVTADPAPTQLIDPPERRLGSVASCPPRVQHDSVFNSPTPLGHSNSRSINPNMVVRRVPQPGTDHLGPQNMEVHASINRETLSKLDSILTPWISHKDTQKHPSSTQLLDKAAPTIVNEIYHFDELPRLEQSSVFSSKLSTLLGPIPGAARNRSPLSPQVLPDNTHSKTVALTANPVGHAQPQIYKHTSPEVSRATILTSPSVEKQPSQRTIPSSVPSSPIFISDNDEYTSADAEGESADGFDFDILEVQHPAAQTQAHSSPAPPPTVIATQLNVSKDTKNHTSIHALYTSVHDAFTPPLTRKPSQTPSRRKSLGAPMHFAYVEVPPLPYGKQKKHYRPLKRRRRANTRYDFYQEKEQEDDSISEYEPNDEKRTSVSTRRRQRGRLKERVRYSPRKEVAQFSASPPISEAYSMVRQRIQRTKAASILPTRDPKEMPVQRGPASTEVIEVSDSPQRDLSLSPHSVVPRSKSPSVASIPLPPPFQRNSDFGLATPAFAHSNTSNISAATHHTSYSQRPSFFNGSDVQEIQVHTIFHPPPTIVYFNTRFAQNAPNDVPTAWFSSGMLATRRCIRPARFVWDTASPVDSLEQGGEELELNVGGKVIWDGCVTDEEQEVEKLLLRVQSKEPTKDKPTRRFATGRREPHMAPADEPRSIETLVPMTPIPKVDMMQVLKSQKAAGVRRTKSTKKQVGKASTRTTHPSARALAPASKLTPRVATETPSFPIPQSLPGFTGDATHLFQHQLYLSEKARGKQKAVDHELVDTTFRMPLLPPSATRSDFRDTLVLSPTNTISGSYHSANPHETFDRQMEDYIVFDLVSSPEKPRDFGVAKDFSLARLPPIVADSVPIASSSSMVQVGSPYQWQDPNNHASNLFLDPSSSGPTPPVLDSPDGLALNSFYDSFGVLPEGEKNGQMMTINPAFLNDNHDDYVTGIELELGEMADDGEISRRELPGEVELGPGISNEISGSRMRHHVVRRSPFSEPSKSPASSSHLLPRTPGCPRTISPAVIVGGTSSPVFSDYHANSHVPGSLNSNTTSQTSSRRSSLAPNSRSRARRRALIVDEDEEGHVQRGLDLAGTTSAADDDYYEGPPFPRQKRQKSSKESRTQLLPIGTEWGAAATTTHPSVRKQEWECGEEESYCHQCRRKTRRLKMTCLCEKKFCNRCITVRYPSIVFRLRLDGFECPHCRNICNCDLCARKRGEVYVSLKVSLGQVPKGEPAVAPTKKPPKQLAARPLVRSEVVPLPLPGPIDHIPGPFSFWGSIYDLDGKKIANAFSGAGEGSAVVANAVEGYTRPRIAEYAVDELPAKRTFIGTCQLSWGLGMDPIIKELGKGSRNRGNDFLNDRGTRWFIGKEDLLHCPVVVYTKNLPLRDPFSDMSSLSSLSDGSDIEATINISTLPKNKIFSSDINDSIKELNNDFDPNAIETRDTVRALIIALKACGLEVKVDQSLVNL